MNKTKKEVLDHIKDRYEAGAFEEGTYRLLEELIKNAKNDDEAILIAELGVGRKTGLNYAKKMEVLTSDIKYLKRNEKLSFKDEKENSLIHKLIIGDNYPALKNLLLTHRHKVDVVYIDPPYGSDSMGKFAETNYENAITRDNLLSMLYPRFILAKQLLSNDAIICCSIDDKNQSYVRCLMDEIFGESNFVANCPRKSAGARTTKSKHELQIIHDYVLIYRHVKNEVLNQRIKGEKKYPFEDERGKYYTVPLQDNGPHGTRSARPNLWYPIYQKEDGTLTLERTTICFLPKQHKHEDGRWMWSKKKFLAEKQDLTIENGEVKIKHYYTEGEDINKYDAFSSWLDKYQNSNGTKILNLILETKVFDNPKPVELIKYLINLCSNKNAIVLDFFAGSGTTGQAVLELNKEDGGQRQFILCTNNEAEDGYIAETVTSKRLKRIMTGSCYDGNTDFEWIKKNEPYGDSLDVFDISEVSANISEGGISPFDVIDETCYDKKFDNIQDKIDWICNNFQGLTKKLED